MCLMIFKLFALCAFNCFLFIMYTNIFQVTEDIHDDKWFKVFMAFVLEIYLTLLYIKKEKNRFFFKNHVRPIQVYQIHELIYIIFLI